MKAFGLLFGAILSLTVKSQAQNLMPVPDTLSGPVISLDLHRDSVHFFPGQITKTFAFNAFRFHGPTLILKKGSSVSLIVNNQMGDTTTIHWHGLHIAPQNDGGPHSLILPGQTWNPRFKVMDEASTYWYHPHLDKRTSEQALRGITGMIIVRDTLEAVLNLPRRYGLDDFPVIVQSLQFDSLNQPMHMGMRDSTLLVNGVINPYVIIPAQIVRLRILNASGERVFNFGLSGNKPFYQIGSDGGLLSAPVPVTRLMLSPGERAEILVDMNGMAGKVLYLMSYASELAMGVQGGPTMYMPPPSPAMDSPLNGVDFNILRINVGIQTAFPVTTVPASLVPVTPYPASSASGYRTINMTSADSMNMDGPFLFNGQAFDMKRIDYTIPLNSLEVWTLINNTMVAHPFHLHGSQFYILDRKGVQPPLSGAGRKDVVLLLPYDTVRIISRFTDFTSDTIPYMFHCHILMHEDAGMMGQFLVSGSVGVQNRKQETGDFLIYPNPTQLEITVIAAASCSGLVKVTVLDLLGRIQMVQQNNGMASEMKLNTRDLAPGQYILQIGTNRGFRFRKFIKN